MVKYFAHLHFLSLTCQGISHSRDIIQDYRNSTFLIFWKDMNNWVKIRLYCYLTVHIWIPLVELIPLCHNHYHLTKCV